ncbi:hypothetical protein BGX31_010610 [Mortierella sp. GBA43]|nr:hypothetical protein BGX31_010610 [Mortierella sp. GBA43]
MPQPNLQPLQEIEKSPSSVSKETLESRAQEYARTVKTLWQMVEDKSLATRLKDASPDERERLIANHKNALFPLKFSASSADGSSARARGHVSSRLSRIDEAGQSSNHRRGCNVSKDGALNRSADGLSETSSMPNSPVAGPINSDAEDAKKARRSTLLSPMVMQSAMELQKRDHYTIQQRVDMEEDWRMQAKLLKSVSEQEARGVRRVHAQLLQRQLQQRRAEGFKEYEPTHQDFNKWFDLKEELDDSQVPDLNDDVRGFDLKEEFEYEDERKERETREEEDLKKKELEELEHELNILGIDRFESLLGFVEADDAEQVVPSSLTPEEQDKHRLRQMILHEQLQEQKKLLAPAPSGAAPPPPPLASRPANSSANASVVVMPLKPRNGRKMFSDCDSMIIKDMPIVAPPTH